MINTLKNEAPVGRFASCAVFNYQSSFRTNPAEIPMDYRKSEAKKCHRQFLRSSDYRFPKGLLQAGFVDNLSNKAVFWPYYRQIIRAGILSYYRGYSQETAYTTGHTLYKSQKVTGNRLKGMGGSQMSKGRRMTGYRCQRQGAVIENGLF